jgi:hypothetical protein
MDSLTKDLIHRSKMHIYRITHMLHLQLMLS